MLVEWGWCLRLPQLPQACRRRQINWIIDATLRPEFYNLVKLGGSYRLSRCFPKIEQAWTEDRRTDVQHHDAAHAAIMSTLTSLSL